MSQMAQNDSLAPSRGLYPEIKPFSQGFLKVSELHEIYYEESGNKNGKPALYLYALLLLLFIFCIFFSV